MKNFCYFILIFACLLLPSCSFFVELFNPSDVSATLEALVDRQGPTLTIEKPAKDNDPVGSTYQIRGYALDNTYTNISNVFISVNGSAYSKVFLLQFNGEWYTNISLSSSGHYTNYVYAIDKKGNYSKTNSRIVYYNGSDINAGIDRIAGIGELVTLSGFALSTNDGSITYLWTAATNNPTNVSLIGADTTTAYFTMPSANGDYTFIFTAFDGIVTNIDSVIITRTNTIPVAYAGTNQTADVSNIVTLYGSGVDSDGDSLIYSWNADTNNPASVTLTTQNISNATFTMPSISGAYTFTMTVFDGVMSNTDSITVNYVTSGLTYSLINSNTEYSVFEYTADAARDVVIPGIYNGMPVTDIRGYAFTNCTGMVKVTIPDSITSIGLSAFYECTTLTNINIPASVTNIASFTFKSCTALASMDIPDSVTNIGEGAFLGCTGLTSITIPNSLKYIDSQTFNLCAGLTNVNIPDSVTNIGDSAFASCTNLSSIIIPNTVKIIGVSAFNSSGLKNINIPDSVTDIGGYTFSGCVGITNVTLPNSITNIPDFTFNLCTGLSYVTIPDTVENIGISAFAKCMSLTNISIPDSVKSIGIRAFEYCFSLTNMIFPDSVTNFQLQALYYCTNLSSVTIGNSVHSIGYDAFNNCTSLKSVTINCEIPPILGSDVFFNTHPDLKIHVPSIAASNAYVSAPGWSAYATNIVYP